MLRGARCVTLKEVHGTIITGQIPYGIIVLGTFLVCHILLCVASRGTIGVSSIDPPCKDDNARFTTVPLTTSSDKNCGR